jgi:hypothetical protein
MGQIEQACAELPVSFPVTVPCVSTNATMQDMRGAAVVLTAGGEGERLKVSLLAQGIAPDLLADFTKATWPIGLYDDFGTLHVNCTILAYVEKIVNTSIPVIITTGPKGSITARIVKSTLEKYNNFGLSQVRVIAQDERLHLTNNEEIVWKLVDDVPEAVANPDETGGPLMRLKVPDAQGDSALDWCKFHGAQKLLVLQATAIYDPLLMYALAKVAQNADGVGVGIERRSFSHSDPYGSYVLMGDKKSARLWIVEAAQCSSSLRQLTDGNGAHVPYNTGFYAFTHQILIDNDLPDYATSPKEIIPTIPKAPKVGYAATDLVALAKTPTVLIAQESQFHVIKSADDLAACAALGRQFHLDALCQSAIKVL